MKACCGTCLVFTTPQLWDILDAITNKKTCILYEYKKMSGSINPHEKQSSDDSAYRTISRLIRYNDIQKQIEGSIAQLAQSPSLELSGIS